MESIAVIGAGWLGLPLAKHLQQLGYQVFASKTTESGINELIQQGIKGFLCNLNEEPAEEGIALSSCDAIIGCFPPGFRRGQGDEYIGQWANLVEQAKRAKVRKIIMVSSTTVYPDLPNAMIETDASLALAENNPEFSTNAKRMLRAEQSVVDSGLNYAIVRCSGLIGPNRHPARFASKLKQVSRLAPANMLHLIDAVGAVTFALQHLDNEIINATTPTTVSKAEFYQAALNSVDSDEPLPPIVDLPDKKIVSDKLTQAGYQFCFSNTLEALQSDE